jgi:N-acetylmuramoyl-L-alanine amidase
MRVVVFFCLVLLNAGCSNHQTIEPVKPTKQIAARHQPIPRLPKIAIDAGHGGKDLGAQSAVAPKAQEKALTLSAALYLNETLQKMGHPTLLTRGGDVFVPLKVRSEFANSNQAALFVSVHFNSAPSKTAEGIEVYYYDSEANNERTARSKALAEKVLEKVTNRLGMKSRGVKKGNFSVIRETKMPAILVEGGFLTNDQEAAKVAKPETLKALADSIALGVKEYYTEYYKMNRNESPAKGVVEGQKGRPRRDSNARPAA